MSATARSLGLGAALAVGAALASAAALAVLGAVVLQPAASVAARPLLGLAAGVLLAALVQEGVLRGWLLRRLAKVLDARVAVVLLALVFVGIHLSRPGESAAGLGGLFLFGLIAGFGALRWGLGFAFGWHGAWNLVQAPVLGFADSGRPPAASLLRAVLLGPGGLTGGRAGLEAAAPSLLIFAGLAAALAAGLGRRSPAQDVDARAAREYQARSFERPGSSAGPKDNGERGRNEPGAPGP